MMIGGIPLNLIAASSAASQPALATLHPDALAWEAAIAANGGSISDPTLAAASEYIFEPLQTLKPKIRQLLLFAGGNLNAARTAAYGVNATLLNFVAGDYSESTGLTGRLGAAVDSALVQTGVNTNDYGLTVYGTNLTGTTPTRYLCGSRESNGTLQAYILSFSTILTAEFNGTAQKPTAPIASGLFSGQAIAANNLKLYEGVGGTVNLVQTNSTSRVAVTPRKPYWMALNDGGAITNSVPNTGKIFAAMASFGLTQAELQTVYTALRAFNLAIARVGTP